MLTKLEKLDEFFPVSIELHFIKLDFSFWAAPMFLKIRVILICFILCLLGFQKGGSGSVGIRERVVPAGAEAFVEEHRAAEAWRR